MDMKELKDFEVREDWESWKDKLNYLGKTEDLDEYCDAILTFFEMHPREEFSSNELYKKLGKFEKAINKSFSKKTMYSHLEHLIELGFIEERVDNESNYVLKPKYYKVNDYLAEIFSSGKYKDYSKIEEEFENETIEYITYSFMKKTINLWMTYYVSVMDSSQPAMMLMNDFNVKMLRYLVVAYSKIVNNRDKQRESYELLVKIGQMIDSSIDKMYRGEI